MYAAIYSSVFFVHFNLLLPFAFRALDANVLDRNVALAARIVSVTYMFS